MTRVTAVLTGTTIVVNINGVTHRQHFQEEDDAILAFQEIDEAKKSKDPGRVNEVVERFKSGFGVSDFIEGLIKRGNGDLFLKGTDFKLPKDLVKKFNYFKEKSLPFDPILNFTKLLALNPDKHVQKDLFKFASHFTLPITDAGYFIGYKSVLWKGEVNKEFSLWLSQQFLKFKSSNRPHSDLHVYIKNEKEFFYKTVDEFNEKVNEEVKTLAETGGLESEIKYELLDSLKETHSDLYILGQQTGEFDVFCALMGSRNIQVQTPLEAAEAKVKAKYEDKGLLTDLFANINDLFDFDDDHFTDVHSKTMDIKMGAPVSMDRKECDNNPSVTCSSGLHIGAPEYVKSFGREDENRYVIACLVNPMNVVAVPEDYNGMKLRCCEYLPYAVCEIDKDGNIVELNTDYFEETYSNYEVEYLNEELKKLSIVSEEDAKEQFNLTQEQLEQRIEMIKNRLVHLN